VDRLFGLCIEAAGDVLGEVILAEDFVDMGGSDLDGDDRLGSVQGYGHSAALILHGCEEGGGGKT